MAPNGHLAAEFLNRARRMIPGQILISMEGAEGSYLLETLTGFVGDRVGRGGAGSPIVPAASFLDVLI